MIAGCPKSHVALIFVVEAHHGEFFAFESNAAFNT
jgi:hypothetical protein